VAFLAGSAGEEAKVVGERRIGGGSVAFDARARRRERRHHGRRSPNVAPGDATVRCRRCSMSPARRAPRVREVTVVSIEARRTPAEPDEWPGGARGVDAAPASAGDRGRRTVGVSLRPVVTVFA
jgi:hypothetical protein